MERPVLERFSYLNTKRSDPIRFSIPIHGITTTTVSVTDDDDDSGPRIVRDNNLRLRIRETRETLRVYAEDEDLSACWHNRGGVSGF